MKQHTLQSLNLVTLVFVFAAAAHGEDFSGRFQLLPVSALELTLEAVGSGTAEGNRVSIGCPTAAQNQVWIVTRKEGNLYALCPATSPNRVLAAAAGGRDNGTLIVLETDAGKSWQRWTIKINANGSVSLLAGHAPSKGLDDFGGGAVPGARQDLWEYHAGDEHLEWLLKPLEGAKVSKEFAAAARLNPLAPKGEVKTFSFSQSRIFPGTQRHGAVFIPAQYNYNSSKAACVYVRQDGYNAAEKRMLESLIAAGDMPVTVGVFVSPGDLPAPVPGTLGRRNRCFEYDAVSDDYVRFLIEELLPYVAQEFHLDLSTRGNDRCIAGGSSGGIAAFNAAWQRPDAFSRVYANSGSFVAFRGGHEFPTLIRKVEAKPIRAYLTTGMHDMVNCAGDWYLLDQEMDQALKFSGYDYFFRAIDGPHVAGWNEYFPEAMRFIWKGWPEAVKSGSSAPRVRDVLLPDEGWKLAAEGFNEARGPACNAKGDVYFADPAADKVFRIGFDGMTGPFLTTAGHAQAVAIGPKREIYTVSETTGQVVCYDEAGSRRIIATGIPGRYVLARPDGTLYITGPGATPDAGSRIWHVSNGRSSVVDSGLKRATGLACRPDQWLLSVADGGSKWVYSYQINEDGGLANKERFFWLHVQDWDDDAGAESVCYAREGQMLVATRFGIQICADDGPTQVILPLPDRSRVLGVCLGGADQNTLFAFCGQKVWKRTIKLHATGAFSPRIAVKGTPL
jgi:enterochelin esterase-like enzyme/sugar lactone lactonase YvrE